QRIGFAAPPAEVARALHDGLDATLARCFARMPDLPKPALIAELEASAGAIGTRLAVGDAAARRDAAQEARERSREALADLTIRCLTLAAQTDNSAAEKWLAFLSDVWVVGAQKVKNSALIYRHQAILREHALGSAVDLARAASRSPAMV